MAITVYTYNDKVLKNAANDKWLKKYVDPYNPLGLPDNTIRVKYISGFTPRSELSMTLIDAENNVWDITYDYHNWNYLFKSSNMGGNNLIEVLGANTTHITNMQEMFNDCTNLTSVSLFDTSNVTNMNSMFLGCSSLTSVPLFNTSSVTNTTNMLTNCYNVQYGALALYTQMSTQTNPPATHNYTFTNCGRDTTTGAAELAQIPSSWGGTAT